MPVKHSVIAIKILYCILYSFNSDYFFVFLYFLYIYIFLEADAIVIVNDKKLKVQYTSVFVGYITPLVMLNK